MSATPGGRDIPHLQIMLFLIDEDVLAASFASADLVVTAVVFVGGAGASGAGLARAS